MIVEATRLLQVFATAARTRAHPHIVMYQLFGLDLRQLRRLAKEATVLSKRLSATILLLLLAASIGLRLVALLAATHLRLQFGNLLVALGELPLQLRHALAKFGEFLQQFSNIIHDVVNLHQISLSAKTNLLNSYLAMKRKVSRP